MIIVTGVARSGTSMMMRMLEFGGMRVLDSGEPPASPQFNVNGFYESTEARRMVISQPDEDIAVKILAAMIPALLVDQPNPPKMIVMRRPYGETAASWSEMCSPQVRTAEATENITNNMLSALAGHLYLEVQYSDVLSSPDQEVDRVIEFLNRPMDRAQMLTVPDQSLRHFGP